MISSDSKIYKKSDEEIAYEKEKQEARSTAIQFLSGRLKSSGNVREKLKEKEYPSYLIEEVLEELEDDHYIDDKKIALLLLKERRGRKAEAKIALKNRMYRFQLPSNLINSVLSEHVSDTILCREFLMGKQNQLVKQYMECTDFEEKQDILIRIIRKAQARGFQNSHVLQSLQTWNEEE